MKNKMYFSSIEDNICYSLEHHLQTAKDEELLEIELIEAIPDNDNKDFVWCSSFCEVIERSLCKKSECMYYTSKSGRNVCSNKGFLYTYGEKVKFEVL